MGPLLAVRIYDCDGADAGVAGAASFALRTAIASRGGPIPKIGEPRTEDLFDMVRYLVLGR